MGGAVALDLVGLGEGAVPLRLVGRWAVSGHFLGA